MATRLSPEITQCREHSVKDVQNVLFTMYARRRVEQRLDEQRRRDERKRREEQEKK